MKHTAGGKPSKTSNRPQHSGLPRAKDLDPPTAKQSKVTRVGQKPSKAKW